MTMQLELQTMRRRSGAVILLAWLALGGPAQSQEEATSETGTPETPAAETVLLTDEEIVVIGQNPAMLRERIRLATDAVYAKYNELNADDNFDIHCRYRATTGTRMLSRVCESNYWRDAQADAGEEVARAMQGSSSFNPDTIYAQARLKSRQMAEEVYRLMLEDDEFRQTLSELGRLVQESRKDRPIARSTASVMTEGLLGEGLLPYGAATVAQVTIGRRPWKHELSQRTFAFGSLRGNIQAIELSCRGGVEEFLVYEAAAEWSLPDDWRNCELRVEATPQTTFAFYEFE